MCVRLRSCMGEYMCLFAGICSYVRPCTGLRTHTRLCILSQAKTKPIGSVCVCDCACVCVCVGVCAYVCMCASAWKCPHTLAVGVLRQRETILSVCVCVCLGLCMRISIYVCVSMCHYVRLWLGNAHTHSKDLLFRIGNKEWVCVFVFGWSIPWH